MTFKKHSRCNRLTDAMDGRLHAGTASAARRLQQKAREMPSLESG
jgi:hypothetical protein